MTEQRNITIKDIAELAGVSIATVSNVINNKGRVSAQTRQLVLKTIEENNYTPNLSARSLKSNQSRLISVLVPHLRRGDFKDNPFFWQLMSAIEPGAHGERFHVILTGAPDGEDLALIEERRLDGIIAIGIDESSDLFARLRMLNTPCVFVDSYITKAPVYQVSSNDRLGGYLGTKYLTSLGYSKIILVSGLEGKIEDKSGVDYQRWLGYRQALEEVGLDYDPASVIAGGETMTGGYYAAQKVHEMITEDTAVFVLSDIGAMGLIRGLNELGITVPDRISIMGYDDIFYCNYMLPALTTIRQNIYGKGEAAIDLLLEQIEGRKTKTKEVVLPVELVVRESTRKRTT